MEQLIKFLANLSERQTVTAHYIIWYDLCWQMDRASILGDAIEYLKELLQRINDLHNELESTTPGSSLTPTTSFHPLTPTPPALPSHIKEELIPSSLPSPNGQAARVKASICDEKSTSMGFTFC